MSTLSTIVSGVGSIVSLIYPPAAPIIGFIKKIEPYAEQAIPIIRAAIKEGPDAFAAAKHAAPEFFAQLNDLGATLKKLSGVDSTVMSENETATIAAHIVGVDPPGWTHEETQRWWDRAQGTL